MCVMDDKSEDFKMDKDGNWIYIPTGKKIKTPNNMLEELIQKLDKLDTEDFFGTEGWRHYLEFED